MADKRLPPDRTPPRNAGFGLWWIFVLIIIFGVIAWVRGADWNQQPVASHNPPAQAPATNSPGNTSGTVPSNQGTPAPAK
jgi:hypothetical protein